VLTVLVSQRVEVVVDRGETRDCLDRAWYPTLLELFGEQAVVPVPNHIAAAKSLLTDSLRPLIVLTGGNDVFETQPEVRERNSVERMLLEYATKHALPVLAVCRGFQHLNVMLGGGLSTSDGHVGTPHTLYSADGSEEFIVNSFHNEAVGESDLAEDLRVELRSKDKLVEAAAHKIQPWLGVMWHPERSNLGHVHQMKFIQRFFDRFKDS